MGAAPHELCGVFARDGGQEGWGVAATLWLGRPSKGGAACMRWAQRGAVQRGLCAQREAAPPGGRLDEESDEGDQGEDAVRDPAVWAVHDDGAGDEEDDEEQAGGGDGGGGGKGGGGDAEEVALERTAGVAEVVEEPAEHGARCERGAQQRREARGDEGRGVVAYGRGAVLGVALMEVVGPEVVEGLHACAGVGCADVARTAGGPRPGAAGAE